MNLQKYITNISGLQVFQLLRFGTLLLISIVFAKSSLSTDAIGRYELFLFIVALFSSFWINGLIQAFLPLYKSNKSFDSKTVRSPEIFNTWLLISFLTLLVIFILLIFNRSLAVLLTSQDSFPYLPLILLYLFFINPSYLIEYIYLLKNRPRSILKYGFTIFLLQFLLVSLPAILGYSLEYCLAGLVVSAFIRYLWLLAVLKKYALFKFSGAFIREHLHFAYPLILTTLLGASANYIDGFLVINKYDRATFAIFRYGAKEFPLVLLMANALSNAMIPEFSSPDKFKESMTILRKKSATLMHFLFPVTILFLLFSKRLYPIVFNQDFAESAMIFNIYLLLIISRLTFPHSILIGLKKTKIIMYASLAELIINIILSVIFIQWWGVAGVAFATVIAFFVQKVIWIFYNHRTLNIPPNKYISVKPLLLYSLITLTVFYFVY